MAAAKATSEKASISGLPSDITECALRDSSLAPPNRMLQLLAAIACLTSKDQWKKLELLMNINIDSSHELLQSKLKAEKTKFASMENTSSKSEVEQKALQRIIQRAKKRLNRDLGHRVLGTMSSGAEVILKRRFIANALKILKSAALVCDGSKRRTITAADIKLVARMSKFYVPIIDDVGGSLVEMQSYAKRLSSRKKHAPDAENEAEKD